MRYRRSKRPFSSVQKWMDATGTSQGELAKLLKISQSHLSNILSGHRRASLVVTLRISETTNVPVEVVAQLARVA